MKENGSREQQCCRDISLYYYLNDYLSFWYHLFWLVPLSLYERFFSIFFLFPTIKLTKFLIASLTPRKWEPNTSNVESPPKNCFGSQSLWWISLNFQRWIWVKMRKSVAKEGGGLIMHFWSHNSHHIFTWPLFFFFPPQSSGKRQGRLSLNIWD